MRYILTILLVAAVLVAAVSCKSKKKPAAEAQTAPKCLVLYYSQTGTTKAVAEEIAKLTGADIEQMDVTEPYDGSYDQTIERCQKERAEGSVPEAKPLNVKVEDYDIVFLGYPIWFGTCARPILGLLAAQDFAGKKVVPFCTFGSGGLESSIADLKAALPKAEIADGYGVRVARLASAPKEIDRFLKENGYVEGEVEPLPEYSETVAVTEEDVAIFDAACGGYQFPLGTPVSVAKRDLPESVDYKYSVTGKGMNGEEMAFTIYVTVGKEQGAAPEFTRVVR